jgi:hypothetical protein
MLGLALRRALALGVAAVALAGAGCGDDDVDELRNKVDKAIDENSSADDLRKLLDDARDKGEEGRAEVERLRRQLRKEAEERAP